MRQGGATSQMKQHQVLQGGNNSGGSQAHNNGMPQINLNLSQNLSSSYHAAKKPQYLNNQNNTKNTSNNQQQQQLQFNHAQIQSTGESNYMPSKQPTQKQNNQKNHNQHMQPSATTNITNNITTNQSMLMLRSRNEHSGKSVTANPILSTSGVGVQGGQSRSKQGKNQGVTGQSNATTAVLSSHHHQQKNVILQQQTPGQVSHNQSINQQLKYSTPTNVGGQNQKYLQTQNSRIASKPTQLQQQQNTQQKQDHLSPPKRNKKIYEMTLRLLEGKIIRDYSKLLMSMSTYLTVDLKKGKQHFKTQQLPSKNPKWNESFKFEVNNIGDEIRITLYNKFIFSREDKLGSLVFSLESLQNYNTTDWFVLFDDDNQSVGSVLINLTSEEIKPVKSSSNGTNLQQQVNDGLDGNNIEVSDVEQDAEPNNSDDGDGDLDENDVDEGDLEQSLDYRDQEISRSLIPRNHIRGGGGGYNERSIGRSGAGIGGGLHSVQGIYKGLHTQQQHQSSASYLHTNQINHAAARHSVTENSVIRHYSSHSSQNSDGAIEIESPNKPGRPHSYYQAKSGGDHSKQQQLNRQSNYTSTGATINNLMARGGLKRGGGIPSSQQQQQQQQVFNPNFASNNEEEQLLPQQLFYGKNQQHHSNSSNNLMLMPQSQQQQQQMRYMNNPNNISNFQFLYLDDLSNGHGAGDHQNHRGEGGRDASNSNHQHRQHCKKSKERSSRRTKKHQHHQKDKQTKKHHHQPLLEVEQFVDDIQQPNFQEGNEEGGVNGGDNEDEEEVNYNHYLNQRSHAQVVQQPISNSQSQQLLSAFSKNPNLNYDSGGNASSGGQQQLYHLTNMGLSGSGGGGYLPAIQGNILGPSYFEDQHSLESMNDGATATNMVNNHHQQQIMHHLHPHQQQQQHSNHTPQTVMMQGMMNKSNNVGNFYDISELQDIEQAKLQLLEENQIMSQQEQQLQQFFAQYNQSKAQLNKDIQLFQEQEKQLSDQKKAFQGQIEEFSKQKRLLSVQKKEFKYQKQQLERRFFNMKRERVLIQQKQKSVEELYSQFNQLVSASQILKNQQIIQMIPQKIDEFIGLMKGISYSLEVLNTSDKFQELDRLMQEELLYQQQQQQLLLQGHIQQESTSSCATNSTGNYNFLLQGGGLFSNQQLHSGSNNLGPNNKSPINNNSPYSMQMQKLAGSHPSHLLSQQFGQSNLGGNANNSINMSNNLQQAIPNNQNMMNQRRKGSAHHLQIGNNSNNNSHSSPKVITDLINTEEEADFLDQEELFKKHSPHLIVDDDDQIDALGGGLDFHSNAPGLNFNAFQSHQMQQLKGVAIDKQLFFNPSAGKGQNIHHFLNEQHELSTIMEKELLTSQRRSSNEGQQVTNTTIDNNNNFRSNQQHQQQQQQVMLHLSQQQHQFLSNSPPENNTQQTSSFQIPTHLSEHANPLMFDTQESGIKDSQQNVLLASKIAELDGYRQAYLDKLAQLTKMEENMFKARDERLKQQQQNQIGGQFSQNEDVLIQVSYDNNFLQPLNNLLQSEDIVHITASEVPTNHNTSQVGILPVLSNQYSTQQQQLQLNNRGDPVGYQPAQQQLQEQLNQVLQEQSQQQQQQREKLEDSMVFTPDPNFLLKINQNMQMNDGKFGQNNNQPKQESQLVNLRVNPQIFYHGPSGEYDNEGNDGNNHQSNLGGEVASTDNYMICGDRSNINIGEGNFQPINFQLPETGQQQQQQQVEQIIDHEDGFDPNDPNFNMVMIMTPEGEMMITQEQYMQIYKGLPGIGDNEVQQVDRQNQHDFLMYQQQLQQYQSNPVDDNEKMVNTVTQSNQEVYGNFVDVLNEENNNNNDYLQNYDCGGTIMHNNKLQTPSLLQPPISQSPSALQPLPTSSSNVESQSQSIKKHLSSQALSQSQEQSKPKKEKLPEDEIIRLINEKYMFEETNKDVSVIYTQDGRIFDQPKKALYGIQRIQGQF